ncbi:MAG: prepilin-type N-terminal cleavage/methylation domain-containing protein [Candidatus Omnitrophota bacterium]
MPHISMMKIEIPRLAVNGLRFAVSGKRLAVFLRKPRTANRKPNQAFTLIELLVVSSMIVVISMAIFATFNNGIKIWQRTQENTREEDLNIFFDRFTNDLRSTFKFTGLGFIGEEDRVEFATLITSRRLQKKTVGKVAYFYDGRSKEIKKEERDFSHIHRDDEGIIKSALSGVESFKLFYYFYDNEKKEYLWLEEWEEEGLYPLAVRMIFEFDDGKEVIEYTKTVDIPISWS